MSGRSVFLESTRADGAWNMALDSYLMEEAARGAFDFVLRTYTWLPPCISFGRLQDPCREVDVARAREAGLDLVRRPTGGRAVWHEHEVTYSVTARESHPLVAGGTEASISRIGAALVDALRSLGVDASVNRAGSGRTHPRDAGSPCFTSHGRFEVEVSGRKLVGSAQARRAGAFLEHGSIITRNDQVRLAGLMKGRGEDGGPRARLTEALVRGVCTLEEAAPGLDHGRIPGALASSFSRAVGSDLERLELSHRDTVRVEELAASARAEADGWR